MPIDFADIALFLISAVACGYCIVLSRRLKKLQDTKDGLGATIVAFSDSIAALSATTGQSKQHVNELANRLPPLIKEANEACARVADAVKTLETKDEVIISRVERTHRELDNSIRALLEETRDSISELTQLSARAQQLYAENPSLNSHSKPSDPVQLRPKLNGTNGRAKEFDHDLF